MNPKKKVLFVITKSNWGGAQRYVYDLATSLPKERFETKVLFGGTGEADAPKGMLGTNLELANVQGLYLKEFMRDISFFRESIVLITLINFLRREKPDVVHLNSSKAGGIGALAARLVGIKKIIFTVHGWPFLENRLLVSKALIWIASWFTVLLCHKVICISNYDLNIGRKMPFVGNRFVLIHNGIAPMRLESGERIRKEFPAGARIVGTIGELTRNKNQIALIEEAKSKSDMYVAIIGFGEDYMKLESKIKEYHLETRVKLFGFVEANQVLKGFDEFVLPSIKEGLPYVLLEARAAGLPIRANRVGGIPDILDALDMSEFSLDRMIEKTLALY